jgi:hypothetical protein
MENAIRLRGRTEQEGSEGVKKFIEELRDIFSHVLRVCIFALFLIFCYPMF